MVDEKPDVSEDESDEEEGRGTEDGDFEGGEGSPKEPVGNLNSVQRCDKPDGPSAAEQKQYSSFSVNFFVIIIHLNVLIYSLCYWSQQTVYPTLSKQVGTDSLLFGYLQHIFAVVQLAGGPMFGRYGDISGGRSAMMIAFGASALSYGLLAVADDWKMLFLSRLPSLCMHALQGGQMIVTDLVPPQERVKAIGRLSFTYGVGMAVGPILGTWISNLQGERGPATFAMVGSLISMMSISTQLPDITKPKLQRIVRQSQRLSNPGIKTITDENGFHSTQVFHAERVKPTIFEVNKYLQVLSYKRAFTLLFVRFATGIPIGIFQCMFPMIALEFYKLDSDQNQYLMTYIALLSMFIQGLFVGGLRNTFSEMQLIRGGIFSLIWSYLALIFVTNIVQLCVILIPIVFGLSVLNIVISAALTNIVPEADTGVVLGMNMAINSLIRTISPFLGSSILSIMGFEIFGFLGLFISFIMTVFLQITFPAVLSP